MIGAIIGDIVGSRFEFDNIRTKKFELFTMGSNFTDDSVMTVAVADALINNKDVTSTLQYYGRKYPGRGYGGRFYSWIYNDNPKPYNSCGNGAAMRISSVGYIAKTPEEVKELSKKVTEVTHNHAEGIKAAEVTAMCIYMALHDFSKEQIEEYAIKEYPVIKNFDYEDLRKNYRFSELSQESVPQAIYCFLISKNFEDCLRTTISIGGDCDTTAAISCAIAEAYYKKIPSKIVQQAKILLPIEFINILEKIN